MKTNRLHKESSPYLLQHKHNPVEWYPWGEEAFARAKEEDKPIFLSIGYSTCYWCHVMEKDSFEVDEVAKVLNEKFIAIKVDREERPDIDQIYMDAVVGLTGHGGWPMSVFLTPDKKPFWGGTFFPRDRFITILERLSIAWQTEKEGVLASASNITETLEARTIDSSTSLPKAGALDNAARAFKKTFDATFGGFGREPKFPPSQQIRLLFRLYAKTNDNELLTIAENTLRSMAYGGIFDQLEGGFHRYATDAAWVIPHFEKMLYDNALLVPAYLDAYQVTGDEDYAKIASDTLHYLTSVMRSPEGGFYSAEDAGEVGKEGEFYVWSMKELRSHLTHDEINAFEQVCPLSEEGNFEGNNILTVKEGVSWSRKSTPEIESILSKLTSIRNQRERPHLDDKILTSWNGLALTAFARAAVVLQSNVFLETAKSLAIFLKSRLCIPNRLQHRYRQGQVGINAFLEDYAYLIEGLCTLYRATFDESYLIWAKSLQEEQDRFLWDENTGAYDFSDAADILFKKKELIDGATPSGNSVSLCNLLTLSVAFPTESYNVKAERILAHIEKGLTAYPTAFSKAMQGLDTFLSPDRELVAIGDDANSLEEINKRYLPTLQIFYSRNPTNSALPMVNVRPHTATGMRFYLCEGQTCKPPVESVEAILGALVGSDNLL